MVSWQAFPPFPPRALRPSRFSPALNSLSLPFQHDTIFNMTRHDTFSTWHDLRQDAQHFKSSSGVISLLKYTFTAKASSSSNFPTFCRMVAWTSSPESFWRLSIGHFNSSPIWVPQIMQTLQSITPRLEDFFLKNINFSFFNWTALERISS